MRKKLFLYLTLACFFGLIAIFIVDGYLGIYDTIYVTAGEREEEIEADFWLRQNLMEPAGVKNAYYVSVNWEEKVFFRYEVDNRQFSSYTADIEVAVWHSQEKIYDLVSQQRQIGAFAKYQLEWVLDTTQFLPGDASAEQSYQFTVTIKRGQIERNIIMYINPAAYSSGTKAGPLLPR
jgi:hypothetical protein